MKFLPTKSHLIAAPRWLLLGLLVYAPWAYGCVRDWTIDVLNQGMLLILILWLAGCVARKAKPVVPLLLWASATFLFLQGWWLIVNAQTYYDRVAHKFVPISNIWSAAPGALDQEMAVPAMLRLSCLLGITCFVADLARRDAWRQRIWWTIGGCGASLILFGLIQKILGAMIYWGEGRTGESFFATYYYHANAGAFINLVLPPIAGLALITFRTPEASRQKTLWGPALLIALAGAAAAASKAALVITLLLTVVFALWRARLLMSAWLSIPSKMVRFTALAAILISLATLIWFGWDRMRYRLVEEPWVEKSYTTRWLAYQACWSMVSDSGLWGFGPGIFQIAFPHYTNPLGDKIEGYWQFAHEDYLQTLIEWGWIGAAVWMIPFFGGMIAGLRTYWRDGVYFTSAARTLLFATLLSLLGVALHALVDFPLQIASLQLYVAVFLGMAWGSASWKPSRSAG